jgi:hypothetical protein
MQILLNPQQRKFYHFLILDSTRVHCLQKTGFGSIFETVKKVTYPTFFNLYHGLKL